MGINELVYNSSHIILHCFFLDGFFSGVCGLKITPVFLAAHQKTCSKCGLKITPYFFQRARKLAQNLPTLILI